MHTWYLCLVSGLAFKYIAVIALQGVTRMRSKTFRWAEDAAQWHGRAAPESPLVERAQAALRNDGEAQPLFLAASAVWLALGPAYPGVVIALYVAARWLHGWWMLRGRQPHRNRVFGLSVLCLLYVVADAFRLAVVPR